MVVGLNKVDLPAARENVPAVRRALERRGYHVYALSAVTGEGITPLLEDVWARLQEVRAERAARPREAPAVAVPPLEEVSVERVPGGFRVRSRRAERAVAMTDLDQPDGLPRLQELLRRFGVTRALEQAGIQPGEAVYIGDTTLTWGE
jgi:GTP-binding protein